ncbi:hypothetical protein, partial [Enterobacter hormaechei]|uniref:hypothetical protein n=1 Tax=Enterobacter hormaechei TaxID=158836 RepID=UPI001954BB60
CADSVALYRQAANITSGYRPSNQPINDAVNIVTRQVYRNGAMDRILAIATAVRCDLAPFLLIEKSVIVRIEQRGEQRGAPR